MGPLPHGAGERRLVEQSNFAWDEQKEDTNGVVDEGQLLGSSEGESRIKATIEDVNNGPEGQVQVHDGLQKPPQQQPQGAIICWERFLPRRSLKVLLVENDDSTRHVVSALLRNCSYEVTAVANGLQAWSVLEDFTNHVDLVLTEVVMPFLTGIGLLCKIMSHKTLKNVPVIMMSSHDSMGLVFKCLSRGAVDFLVKPIRKNELKNLWQHVWRRCHSSSGSGSESGTQTKKSAKSRSNEESENNTGSSDERDNGSIGLSIRDGSDNGSGTQSSWTKRGAENDSPRPISPWDQLTDAPDSTCAQVIHTKPETYSNSLMHKTETNESKGEHEQLDNVAMGKELKIGISRNPDLPLECEGEKFSIHPRSKRQNKLSDKDCRPLDKGLLEHNSENMSGKMIDQTVSLMNAAVCTNTSVENEAIEAPIGLSDISQIKDKARYDSREPPSLELSLRRLRGVADFGTAAHDERNVLRHSDLSAFSKYNNGSSGNQCPSGNVGSCSPLDNSSVAMKTETMHNFASNSSGTQANQQSNGSSNNDDMVSTTKHAIPKPEALNDKSESASAFRYFHSAFQPVQNGRVCQAQQVVSGKTDDVMVNLDQAEPRSSHLQVQVQHHHHHYHHYHHHVHNMQQRQQQQQLDHDDCSLKNMAAAAPQCGSSNVLGVEGNAGNYSMNGSPSGSNNGSNGQNGSSTALNAGAANMESDNGVAGNSGTGGIGGISTGNGVVEERCAQREAALTKFRQKRKERCFEKKVRYQSRKRLAEQRPRVRGQFVRQTMCDSKAEKDWQSSDPTSRDSSCDR